LARPPSPAGDPLAPPVVDAPPDSEEPPAPAPPSSEDPGALSELHASTEEQSATQYGTAL
jgi:hypothetical protein